MLSACENTSDTEVTVLPKGNYVRFASNIGEQLQKDKEQQEKLDAIMEKLSEDFSQRDILEKFGLPTEALDIDWSQSCILNKLSFDGEEIKSTRHKIKRECNCMTVQQSDAVHCLGDSVQPNEKLSYVTGVLDSAKQGLTRFIGDKICPSQSSVEGIPYIEPECLGDSAIGWAYVPNTSQGDKYRIFVGEALILGEFILNNVAASSSRSYITQEGLSATAVKYQSVPHPYENCDLNAEVVFSIDQSGNLVPARYPDDIQNEQDSIPDPVNPVNDITYVIDQHLTSDEEIECSMTIESDDNDEANSTSIDNAQSPYEGLEITQTFGPLKDGVLTLDYSKTYYRVDEN